MPDRIQRVNTHKPKPIPLQGIARACRLLRLKYGVALECRTKQLMAHKGDGNGQRLMSFSELWWAIGTQGYIKDKTRIYLSRTGETKKTHALSTTISLVVDQTLLVRKEDMRFGAITGVPIVADENPTARKNDSIYLDGSLYWLQLRKKLTVVLVTDGSERFKDRFSVVIPRLVSGCSAAEQRQQRPHGEALSALEEVKRGMRGTPWKACVQYHLLCNNFVVRELSARMKRIKDGVNIR